MATEASVEAEHEAESNEDEATETPEVETEAGSEGEETADDEAKPDDEGEKATEPPKDEAKPLTVTLDDDDEGPLPSPDKANKAFAELRRQKREAERERDELRAKLAQPAKQEAAPTLPPPPKSSDPDIGYDEEKLATRMREWVKQEAKVEAHKAKIKAEAEQNGQEWQKVLNRFADCRNAAIDDAEPAKAKAKAERFHDAELFIVKTMSDVQRSVLLEVAENPAVLALTLAKYPEEAQALAAIKSLPQFTKALVRLENRVSVTPPTKKPKAPPEPTISSGGGSSVTTTDKTLERLEAEADKTGDRAAVQRYKREQAEKQKKK